jgi:hypothetical protein
VVSILGVLFIADLVVIVEIFILSLFFIHLTVIAIRC